MLKQNSSSLKAAGFEQMSLAAVQCSSWQDNVSSSKEEEVA